MASHGERQKQWSAGCESRQCGGSSRPGRRHGTPADKLGLEGWQTPCKPWKAMAWLVVVNLKCRIGWAELRPVTDPSVPPM